MEDFILLKDMDWFGKVILSGTVYKQVNKDYYHPIINGARCPSMQIYFYTVLNNNEYFLKILNYYKYAFSGAGFIFFLLRHVRRSLPIAIKQVSGKF